MCLAVPGKLIEWLERESPFEEALIEFGGIRRRVNMSCIPAATEGQYVLVHAGVAISIIDSEEAARVFESIQDLDDHLDTAELEDSADETS